jgi:L-ascorbate metabolism protein UlaG (beta-lactamase superfamily)
MVVCRFLGNACVEIISEKDHIIIDPVFISKPKKGIESIFLTHHHPDHTNLEKINEISRSFSKEGKDLEIYGPECIHDEFNIDFTLILPGSKVDLNNGYVEVFENNCWKAEGCVAYLVEIEGKKILHTADSADYSGQLNTIKDKINYCFVACFEDNFYDYLGFLKNLNLKTAIPYHFTIEKEESAKKLTEFLKLNKINSKFLAIGEEFEL